jgi:lysophospholipase L1-like esterase
LYRGIEGLEGRYPAAIGVSVPQGQDERRAESKSLQVEIWKKHIGLQRQVERTRGVPAYFFLQPNQYLQDSKPLSVEERATAINSDVADINHAQISILRRAVQDLATKGVPVFGLTGIFQETPATVCVDACCHMNELGNQIMAQHIVSVLAEQAMGNNARQ